MEGQQRFFGVFFSEMMSAHERGNGIGHFSVAKYLAEFSTVHLVR
jgi:hypothetical protein